MASVNDTDLSRRKFLKTFALGTAVLAYGTSLRRYGLGGPLFQQSGPAVFRYDMNQNWLFGGEFKQEALRPGFEDESFRKVTLPHCVNDLSWHNWDPYTWERLWIYRRHFDLPQESKGRRIFLNFEAVMVGTTPVVNGHGFPQYLCGYLPSRFEITDYVKETGNVLAVQVDSRWSNTPPEGSPEGPRRIDYLEPGGIIRPAYLEIVPRTYIADVFAKPVKVLGAHRRVEVTCTIDAAGAIPENTEMEVELREGETVIARAKEKANIESVGRSRVMLTLTKLGNIKLWSPDNPQLYNVVTTLLVGGHPVHDYQVRIGFREARFELDGFFLNGKRLQIFGLNRHELFPYVGFAMPKRVMHQDAEILRHELNCNMVRCSHYPQSEAFYNACDELGLMVWEEVPGWGYVGDEAWKERLVGDLTEMVTRDRNHPSIVIWGVRANESNNQPELYRKTKAIADSLDGTRQTSGTMTSDSTKGWHQEVFAMDDYRAGPEGGPLIGAPPEGVPYLVTEAVGTYNYKDPKKGFGLKYRRTGDIFFQQAQAIWHAQAHDRAAANPRISGVLAWLSFDYESLKNAYNTVKCPGVLDIFRIPKLGASYYLAQVSPDVHPVIEPDFYWDFGARTPHGPGKNSAIFSNCGRLDLFVDGKRYVSLKPDSSRFRNTKYPPFFVDLELSGAGKPELRIDGFVGNKLVLSKSYSSDPSEDRFLASVDDEEIFGDGSDSTRLVFMVTDKFGTPRLLAGGEVTFKLTGPGIMVGDNPFLLDDSGGVGATWIKSMPNSSGRIKLDVAHSFYGTKSIEVNVKRGTSVRRI